MANLWRKLCRDASGATAIEYGLIVSLVVIVLVSAIVGVGGTTGSIWDNMANKASAVMPNP